MERVAKRDTQHFTLTHALYSQIGREHCSARKGVQNGARMMLSLKNNRSLRLTHDIISAKSLQKQSVEGSLHRRGKGIAQLHQKRSSLYDMEELANKLGVCSLKI